MAPSLLVSLIGLLLHSAPTLHHPIPAQELQDRISEDGQDSIRAHHQLLASSDPSDRLRRQRRGEGEQLTAEAAADTLKKINPLTIADQVADRMRKNNKQSPAGDTGERPAKDFGYSVIVMAGDPVKLPIAVHGKGVRVVAKGAKTVDGRQRKVYEVAAKDSAGNKKSPATEELADADSLYSVKQQKEVRVPKKYDVDPNFPVYDEDFNFVPDPFHGILDESYLQETGGARVKGGRQPHSILVRSNVFDEVDAETTPCGQSWREPVNNSTNAQTLADRTSDQGR